MGVFRYICAGYYEICATMKQKLIGREQEIEALNKYYNSGRSEFIAVYGRRRVGKTFLIRRSVDDQFAFFMTGVHGASKTDQLLNFSIALQKYSKAPTICLHRNWLLAFHALATYLETLPEGNKYVFIDELPWMDTPRSGFIAALENFWNSWAVLRNDIKLIVCGSATSWMINNLIHNRGGLHNRLTHHIQVNPFTLHECEAYFAAYNFGYSRKQIAECYMVMGGIPYYMSMLDRSISLAQNIDQMFFADNAELANEFDDLYRALFRKSATHVAVVTALATKGIGMTRQELVSATDVTDNGLFSTILEELQQCGFIRAYEPFTNGRATATQRQSRDTLFQLIDFYTLFYFKFVRNNRYRDPHFWSTSLNSAVHNAWAGLSFEMLCLSHVETIKQALGISGVQTLVCSWRSAEKSGNGAQIDLLIDRKDETVNLCEIKFCNDEYAIDNDYEQRLRRKVNTFMAETKTNKSVILTMITTFGIKENKYSDMVQKRIVLNDLFAPIFA